MDIWKNCFYKGVNGEVLTFNCIPYLFQNLLTWLFAFAGIAALFFIIFAGIKFITSGGDAKQVESARKTLTYAIIGLVVILLSGLILNLVSDITNVGCIEMFGFTNCQ